MPSTRTSRRRRGAQEGQAIVLIALLVLVLFGMLGLAIDSGRAYVDRRDQQTAVDAAALAAGDWYLNYFDLNTYAIPKSVLVYQTDLRLYSGYTSSSHTTTNVGPNLSLTQDTYTYNYASGYTLTVVATNTLFNGYQFVYTTSHNLPLAFIQVFGGSPTVGISATATSIVGNQRTTPALLTLYTGTCATTVTGTATVTVLGDVYTNGTACVTSNLLLGGNCYGAAGSNCSAASYYCYSASGAPPYPPLCRPGDIQGAPVVPSPSLPDPLYTANSVGSYQASQPNPTPGNRSTWSELQPGVYQNYFHLSGSNATCYFLDPGVYSFNNSYQSDATGSLVSNEMKPPDEQLYTAPGTTQLALPQFWNMNSANCAGDFNLTMVSTPGGNGIAEKGPRNKLNQWGVVLTSVRFDTFNDTSFAINPCLNSPGCPRESAPSECQVTPGNMTNNGTTGVDVNITKNAPGAQYYNVYLNVNGCDGIPGNFAFYGRFLVPGFRDAGGVPPASGANPYMGGAPPATPDGSALNPWPTQTPLFPISLGFTTYQPAGFASIMNFNHLGVLYTPTRCNGLTRNQGCLPPDNETQPQCFNNCPPPPNLLSQENAPMALEYSPYNGGDVSNENYCVPSPNPGIVAAPCQGAQITPGAVQFYFPPSPPSGVVGGSCMTQNAQGATYVYSGIQYNWIIIYAPATNTCPNKLNGGASTQYIGTIYTPGAGWTISGGSRTPLAGQVICYTAAFQGNAGVGIAYNPNYAPAPPAARLIN